MGTDSALTRRKTLLVGVVTGAVAYLAGYLVFVSIGGGKLALVFGMDMLTRETAPPPSDWTWAGLFFYAHHFVDLIYTVSQDQAVVERQEYLLGGMNPLHLLIPVLFLSVAGGLTTLVSKTKRRREELLTGAAVTAGYFPLTAAGLLLFQWEVEESENDVQVITSLGPDLIDSLVVMGLIYPVVFGAIGGVIIGVLRSS